MGFPVGKFHFIHLKYLDLSLAVYLLKNLDIRLGWLVMGCWGGRTLLSRQTALFTKAGSPAENVVVVREREQERSNLKSPRVWTWPWRRGTKRRRKGTTLLTAHVNTPFHSTSRYIMSVQYVLFKQICWNKCCTIDNKTEIPTV